jgi:hypothetical protein
VLNVLNLSVGKKWEKGSRRYSINNDRISTKFGQENDLTYRHTISNW